VNDQTYLPDGALPAPEPMNDGLDRPYWEGLHASVLRLQRCVPCQAFQWGPEWICHRCLGEDLEWVAVPPVGTIYSWERVWHPVTPALADAVPYLAVIVEVEGTGVRLVGNLLGARDQQVRIGTRVEGVFERHEGYSLLQWRTAG
jgi:uncharacterized OB-fold protein